MKDEFFPSSLKTLRVFDSLAVVASDTISTLIKAKVERIGAKAVKRTRHRTEENGKLQRARGRKVELEGIDVYEA